MPVGAVEGDVESSVDGDGVDFAAEVVEGEAAVGGAGADLSLEVGEVDARRFLSGGLLRGGVGRGGGS